MPKSNLNDLKSFAEIARSGGFDECCVYLDKDGVHSLQKRPHGRTMKWIGMFARLEYVAGQSNN